MGISPTIASGSGDEAHGVCALRKLLHANLERVQASLISNCGEFAIIKIRIVNTLPYAKKLHCVAIAKPISHKEITILGF